MLFWLDLCVHVCYVLVLVFWFWNLCMSWVLLLEIWNLMLWVISQTFGIIMHILFGTKMIALLFVTLVFCNLLAKQVELLLSCTCLRRCPRRNSVLYVTAWNPTNSLSTNAELYVLSLTQVFSFLWTWSVWTTGTLDVTTLSFCFSLSFGRVVHRTRLTKRKETNLNKPMILWHVGQSIYVHAARSSGPKFPLNATGKHFQFWCVVGGALRSTAP